MLGSPLMVAAALSGVQPTLKLDFLSGTALDPRIAFTRASSRTRVNEQGLVETLTTNAPALNHDPVTRARRGLLLEEARTNLLLRSEQIGGAGWNLIDCTVSGNAIVAPDGTMTADKIVEGTGSGVKIPFQTVNKAAVVLTRTMSFYGKAGERTQIRAAFANQNASSAAACDIDLVAGTAGVIGYSGTAVTAASVSVTPVGNGWFRCTMTATFDAGVTGTAFYPSLVNGSGVTIYAGDGTSGLYLWGVQVEDGAFATSYIQTVASTVARAEDVPLMSGTNFSDWFNPAEGTFLVEADTFKPTTLAASATAVAVSDGTANERFLLRFLTGNAEGAIVDGNVVQAQMQQAYTPNSVERLALAYKADNFAFARNGVLAATDFVGTLPTVDRLNFGAPPLNGHVRRLFYWPKALPDRLPHLTLAA